MLPSCREGLHAGPVAEGRRHVEVRLPVVLLDEGRGVGPAEAEVQGQVGPDLEVVLDEERDPVLEVRPRVVGVAAATALARHLVEEEVGEGDAGEGAGVAEEAERAVVAGVVAALDVAQELAAELQGVAALDPGQLLVELVALREVVLEGRRGADGGEAAAPVDRAQARDRLPAGDPVGRVGVADAAPVVQRGDVVDRVVPDQDLVDQRGAEDVAPVDRQVAERGLGQAAGEEREGRLLRP